MLPWTLFLVVLVWAVVATIFAILWWRRALELEKQASEHFSMMARRTHVD